METSSGEKDFSGMETQQWDKSSRGKVQHHHPFEKGFEHHYFSKNISKSQRPFKKLFERIDATDFSV